MIAPLLLSQTGFLLSQKSFYYWSTLKSVKMNLGLTYHIILINGTYAEQPEVYS